MHPGTIRSARRARRAVFVAVAVAACAALSARSSLPATETPPLEVSVGWAHTDVGLDQDGDGLVVGLGSRLTLVPAALDLIYALEYVQKRGAQPTWFADPVDAFVLADAEVTLHVVQPVALVEWTTLPLRPYAGLSVALKLSEQWSEFPGEPSSEWGYKDVDFVSHFGLTRGFGPVRLDLRYSYGLTDQLIADPTAGAPVKAEDPLPGVATPEEGAHLSQWQLTAAMAF